jgi:hypothetical protein
VVIDRHGQELPACAVCAVAALAGHPVAGPLDPPELLGEASQLGGAAQRIELHRGHKGRCRHADRDWPVSFAALATPVRSRHCPK